MEMQDNEVILRYLQVKNMESHLQLTKP